MVLSKELYRDYLKYLDPVFVCLCQFCLTLTTLWADSADNKLTIFYFFLENSIWHFMQIISLGDNLHDFSLGDNLHEVSNPIFKETEKYSKCHRLKFFTQHAKCYSLMALLTNLSCQAVSQRGREKEWDRRQRLIILVLLQVKEEHSCQKQMMAGWTLPLPTVCILHWTCP